MADPGGAAGARPHGSRFFRFDIQIFQNVAALGVGAPPMRSAPPLRENPGSATENDDNYFTSSICNRSVAISETYFTFLYVHPKLVVKIAQWFYSPCLQDSGSLSL